MKQPIITDPPTQVNESLPTKCALQGEIYFCCLSSSPTWLQRFPAAPVEPGSLRHFSGNKHSLGC